ncbi:MAG: S8 family serine peptidase [Saprospiraceae bacterium]
MQSMTGKIYSVIFFFLLSFASASAQTVERRTGELLLQLNEEASPATVLYQLKAALPVALDLVWKEPVAPGWQIYLLGFDEKLVSPDVMLAAARRLPDVRNAQWNHRTEERATFPNDPDWFKQDDMELIGMPDAWDVTTGGLSPAGDTIVVAVLEKGSLLSHPDLLPNLWLNWGEIPGNDIDDDGNGYADDYRGWNPRTKDDNMGTPGFHGTAVNGIIGAAGNNGTGVTGVNWKVKLMNLANVEFESEIIAAYKYVADMRRLYNATNGAKGAFVVSSNASFGIDFEYASDHPLWCAVYDSLGTVGIVSVGATANKDTNVDTQGDMPSTCPSRYLIAVNNVGLLGTKVPSTGYGSTHIDLGAPGEGTYTSRSQDQSPTYGTFNGTSASTPHVTGALALFYSLNCALLTADAKTSPAVCAQRMRDLILENVVPEPSLNGITTTGGRLGVSRAVKAVLESCDGATTGPLSILWVRPNPVFDELLVRYQSPTYSAYQIVIHNMLGQQLYEETVTPNPFSSNIWKYDASALPRGAYSVSFGRNDAWRSEIFIKK